MAEWLHLQAHTVSFLVWEFSYQRMPQLLMPRDCYCICYLTYWFCLWIDYIHRAQLRRGFAAPLAGIAAEFAREERGLIRLHLSHLSLCVSSRSLPWINKVVLKAQLNSCHSGQSLQSTGFCCSNPEVPALSTGVEVLVPARAPTVVTLQLPCGTRGSQSLLNLGESLIYFK